MPPKQIRLVTYAWGQRYIDRLLDFTLASVLAPGNLPALARAFDCTVVVVTEKGLFDYVRAHPIARQAGAVCPLRLVALDDLVAEPWQYGLTVAYSLFRGFAELGPAMTDTYLLFLNSDFLVADGSYERLVPRIVKGERVLLAPSYCVVEERVSPLLSDRRDSVTGTLAFPPRQLAQLIIDHRHNTIRAKTVNQRLVHFEYMDQFYWLVDKHTLLGHQMPISLIGMRPERALTDLTTFWDWGIVYDFCPSKRLTALGDSDEFLMMEMRSEDTYFDSIRLGSRRPRAAAAKLATYITEYQLDNVRFPLTLHSRALPSDVESARTSLRSYVDEILRLLPSAPIDHRTHAHWAYHKRHFEQYQATKATRAETASLKAEIARLEEATRAEAASLKAEIARLEDEYRAAVESVTQRYEPKLQAVRKVLERLEYDGQSPEHSELSVERSELAQNTSGPDEAQLVNELGKEPQTVATAPAAAPPRVPPVAGLIKQLARRVFDAFPYTRPWHPLHLPYRRLSVALTQALDHDSPSILAVCRPESPLARMVAALPGTHARLSASDLLKGDASGLGSDVTSFDVSILELSITELSQAPELYSAVLPHMDSNGTVVIHGSNLGLAPREGWERAVIHCLIRQPLAAEVHYSGSWAGLRALKLLRLAYQILGSSRRGSRYYRLPLVAGIAAGIGSLALVARIQEGTVERQSSSIPSACTGVTVEITAGSKHRWK